MASAHGCWLTSRHGILNPSHCIFSPSHVDCPTDVTLCHHPAGICTRPHPAGRQVLEGKDGCVLPILQPVPCRTRFRVPSEESVTCRFRRSLRPGPACVRPCGRPRVAVFSRHPEWLAQSARSQPNTALQESPSVPAGQRSACAVTSLESLCPEAHTPRIPKRWCSGSKVPEGCLRGRRDPTELVTS